MGRTDTQTGNTHEMLQDFFPSAAKALTQDGKVMVTLASMFHVERLELGTMARAAGLKLETIKTFDAAEFPGYEHKMTVKNKSAASAEKGPGRVFIFVGDTK